MLVLPHGNRSPSATLHKITWPCIEERKKCAELLQNNRTFGPLLKGVFGIATGGRFRCQNYGDTDPQNAHCEDYTQQEEVKNLFVSNFIGEIIHAAINFPGSWHDTEMAGV